MGELTNHPGLSEHQKRVLARVLDEMIPPSDDGRLPGAGQLGVADHVEQALRTVPALSAMIVQGLSALDRLALRRNADGFAALPREDRSAVMNELASSDDAFPPILILHAFAGYYQQARVLEALGLEPRPPHPKGYEMGPDDLTLLDPVRRRERLFRQP